MSEQIEINRRLSKVIKVSTIDYYSVLAVAGCAVPICALGGYWLEAIFALLACTAGLLERHGNKLLQTAQLTNGFKSLVSSQLLLLAVILVYAVWKLLTADAGEWLARISSYPIMQEFLKGYPYPELLQPALELSLKLTYSLLFVISLFFQGGLAWWYRHTGRLLKKAITPPLLQQS